MKPIDVYITSFKQSVTLPDHVERLSVAVYQPKGFNYRKIDAFDIRVDGHWTRPRDFIPEQHDAAPSLDIVNTYFTALAGVYLRKSDLITGFINDLDHDVALCCWCPYDKAAQRQLKDYGSFVCHTAVVGRLLEGSFNVVYDSDRERMVKVP